ncbi:tRNA dihydrouridine(20/20a) synthase DusA [Aliiglaciecola sp. CAU 1673]|uniref:tRNA dihydrouridine(20/20a) synthase DusA n=1 Tax=Aliiglaciecola sp. CAU 1673 TaxID=3032595 RepID=UPI0023DB150A|nr:tRNA dihydrouridine(20/20a) synthase DusA [Aliiglaciecola sp. CAU 1673]MDF2180317.1 tRNA dihydrouridine(20/20a) synthase DusA [Aliiglaciecola sp. CAU 1673]
MVQQSTSHQQDLANSRRLSVAPMLDWTDKHCRFFLRLLSRHALLYTEMVTTGAIIFGKGDYLAFNAEEHPVALQLGGSDPGAMAECAARAQAYGYDEVNINVGCPSDRVQNGRFGACLMAEPQTVADCIKAMQRQVSIPVTVKSRIGIDDMDEFEDLTRFVQVVADAGCDTFIVHARKAWLQGLSPKENRDIPPLNYERVYQLKQQFPTLHISINGGIKSLRETQAHLQHVDGVMIGREVYANPYLLAEADSSLFGEILPVPSRLAVVEKMIPYINQQVAEGARVWHVARHMLGLFQGQPGGRLWRRYLSEQGPRAISGDLLYGALEAMQGGQKQHFLQQAG